MFNPFAKFDERFITGFRNAQKRYLVSQTFKRATDHFTDEEKINLILSHYDDLGLAKIHLNAISKDKYASIIDLEKDAHRNKLTEMLQPGSKYSIYTSLITDQTAIVKQTDIIFKDKIKKYLSTSTNWRIGRNDEVKTKLEITFGELFFTIAFRTQKVRVALEELENIR